MFIGIQQCIKLLSIKLILIPTKNHNIVDIGFYGDDDRAKSTCEILGIKIGVTYFIFDTEVFNIDAGSNFLQTITSLIPSISSRRLCEAIHFNGSVSSYFQISRLLSLGITNKAFSISL
ncbi:hypothetical protein I4U23_020158 [Adineta vaga]|nr:hypothetical protein I4U23_020158 [Adineta vaga]